MGLVDELITRFGGKQKSSKLLGIKSSTKFNYRSMRVEAEVSPTGVLLVIDNFPNSREVMFSVYRAVPTFAAHATVTGIDAFDLPVFSSNTCDDEVRASLSDNANATDIRDLDLDRGEYVLVFANGFMLQLSRSSVDRVQEKLDIIHRIFDRYAQSSPAPSSQESEARAMRIHSERSAESAHFFGGTSSNLPSCSNCNASFHQLLTLQLDSDLSIDGYAPTTLRIIACLNCDALTSPLHCTYDDDGQLTVLQQEPGQSFGDFPAAFDERSLSVHNIGSAKNDKSQPWHKFGGQPDWLQNPAPSTCIKCDKPMTFILQLDTDPTVDLQFEDDGRLYAFICADCQTLTTFAQSH